MESIMAYRNKYDQTGDSFQLGLDAESAFVAAAQKEGMRVEKSSKRDEFKHIDFYIHTPSNLKFSVEVKSRKKIKRNDDKVNDEFLWVEFKNVQGLRGWLYGSADLVAFERENDFVLVNRKLLARLCEKLCDLTKINVDVKMPLYTGYQRRGRLDLVSLIKMSDILTNIKYSVFKK